MISSKLAIALCLVVAASAAISAPKTVPPTGKRGSVTSAPFEKPRLDHIAVWTADLDATARFLSDALGWRRHPIEFGIDDSDMQFGGMKLIFIDANGFWLELIQPTTPGPGMDLLKEKGDGALVELDFAVSDFNKNIRMMKERGAPLAGMGGQPMQNGGLLQEWVIKDGKRTTANEYVSYPSPHASRGTSIEMYWEDETGVTVSRDAMWKAAGMDGVRAGPRLDHAVLLASDLAKTTAFYRGTFGLPALTKSHGVRSDWMGVGDNRQSWIKANENGFGLQLVGSPSTAAGAALLSRYGDGNIMELAVEVPDIDAFYDQMSAKGIRMTAGNALALPAGKKAVASNTGAIRYNYFPVEKSAGMRIMVFQRASGKR